MKFDKRLLGLIKDSPFTLALTILLGLVGGVLTVLQARFLSRAISQVFLQGQGLAEVAGLLEILLAVILLRATLIWGSEVAANSAAVQIKTSLRQKLVNSLLALGPLYNRQGERTGELVNTAVEGIEALDPYFSQYLPQAALAALVPLTFLAFIFPLDSLSGIILLLTAPLIPIFMILIGSAAEGLTRRQWQTLSRLSAHFLDVMQGLTTLKMLGRSRAQAEGIERASDSYRRITMRVLRVSFLSALALEMISTLSTAVVAVEVGLRLLYGRLTFEQAFFVLLLAPEFYLPLRMLGTRFHAGMAGIAAAGRIFDIIGDQGSVTRDQGEGASDQRSATGDQGQATGINQSHLPPLPLSSVLCCRDGGNGGLGPSIEFKDVSYNYESGRHALNGVSFTIPVGQRMAVVGPSGAGKSTLAALLLGFILPAQGEIRVNGAPLQEFEPELWRRQISWVPQLPYLFHDTIEANIRLARPKATSEEVIQAARRANAHEFILDLPQGYQTLVGERGARLSGGQAQRIALARAFLKDAPFLILDEATANLDPEQEDGIQQAIQRLLAGRTALVIAHRLNTVVRAEHILVLDQGRVAEEGTHAELAGQGGLYSRLVQAYVQPESPLTGARRCCEIVRLTTPQKGTAGQKGAAEQEGTLDQEGAAVQTAGQVKFQPGEEELGIFPSSASPRSNVQVLLRLLHLIAPYKGMVALSVLLGFATLGSSLGLMATSAYIIASAALHPSIAELEVAIVGVRFFGISRGLFRYLERYVSHQVTFHLLARLRVWFYQALEPLAPARLISYRSGDLLSRAIGDIASLENFYVRVLSPSLVAALVAVFMGIFFSFYSPLLAASLLVCLLLAGACLPALTHLLSRRAGARLVSLRAAIQNSLVDTIQGMADLLAFGQAETQAASVQAIGADLAARQKEMARIAGLNSALGSLLSGLGMWVVLVLAIPMVRSGQISGVSLAVLTLAALTCFEAVLPLPAAAQYLESNLQAARRLFEMVDVKPEVQDIPNPLPLPIWNHHGKESPRPNHPFNLEVSDLSFSYSPLPLSSDFCCREGGSGGLGPSYTLQDLTFHLPFGKHLAIVGPSGSGKSTLVNLLLRFWELQEGEVRLGRYDLRCYAQEELRRSIAVVSQNTYLFNATLRENLVLARPEASQAEIDAAVRMAHIHDFIQRLPQGYDTWIGEQGLRLSGGERQRLAIARALLKDAPLLVLDEPTANLDTLTEREVLDSIFDLIAGRSALLITHRLAGLETMDEILVLRQGCIVERGTHQELLKFGGYYRRMWDLQNQNLN